VLSSLSNSSAAVANVDRLPRSIGDELAWRVSPAGSCDVTMWTSHLHAVEEGSAGVHSGGGSHNRVPRDVLRVVKGRTSGYKTCTFAVCMTRIIDEDSKHQQTAASSHAAHEY
jgi:hypothetical protein